MPSLREDEPRGSATRRIRTPARHPAHPSRDEPSRGAPHDPRAGYGDGVVDDASSSAASTASLAQIPQRLAEVRRRIVEASADRGPDAVRLIAVSKGQSVEAIRAAWDQGQRDFGENYVQELVSKAEQLGDLTDGGLRWHAIGRLQRNKARDVARIASVIHAVDRAELAREIDRRASAADRRAPGGSASAPGGSATARLEVLVEVNVGAEASKGGCAPAEVGPLLDAIAGCPNLVVRGLMTIPPETDSPEDARPFFRALRELRDRHGGAAALPELSMGMSHDFEIAITEGATIVRVGTAIFGPRSRAADRPQ